MRWWHLAAVHQIEKDIYPTTAWSLATFWSELAGVPDTRAYFCLCAESSGGKLADEIIGYGGVSFSGDQADIQTLAVTADMQRRGFGRLLLNHLVDCAADRGAEEVLLDVGSTNEAALRLYQKTGFSEISRRKGCYRGYEETIVMRKPLMHKPLKTGNPRPTSLEV